MFSTEAKLSEHPQTKTLQQINESVHSHSAEILKFTVCTNIKDSHTRGPESLFGCWEWVRKVCVHQQQAYEWKNCLCSGTTQSQSISFDGVPKRIWQPPGCDCCGLGWWGHTCGCLVYSVAMWGRLSTCSSWGLAATVALALQVHSSCYLYICFNNNKFLSLLSSMLFSAHTFTPLCSYSLSFIQMCSNYSEVKKLE